MPLSNFKISNNFLTKAHDPRYQRIEGGVQLNDIYDENATNFAQTSENTMFQRFDLNIKRIIYPLYLIISSIIFLILIIHLFFILFLSIISVKTREENSTFFSSEKIKSPFTFFSWIYLPTNMSESENKAEIIIHEKAHASQLHSIDLLLMNMLSIVMWFNPLVWLMRKSLLQVHEYIADDKVINSGFNLFNYQALLINLVAEEKFISISSGFKQSLIKNRFIMMNNANSNKDSRPRYLTLIPIILLLFLGVSLINGQASQNVDSIGSKVFTVLIDAGHGGKDPGAIINGNIKEKDLTLSYINAFKKKAPSYKNLKLVFTREDDEFRELNQRVNNPSDLLVSVHLWTSPNTELSGIDCYIGSESEYKEESVAIGNLILSELKQVNGIKTQNSSKEANFFILNNCKCPAILINLGFISNEGDLSFISDKNYQDLICDKILYSISNLD
jgi:N-acetylmuramoyl-L-alanine amidase